MNLKEESIVFKNPYLTCLYDADTSWVINNRIGNTDGKKLSLPELLIAAKIMSYFISKPYYVISQQFNPLKLLPSR